MVFLIFIDFKPCLMIFNVFQYFNYFSIRLKIFSRFPIFLILGDSRGFSGAAFSAPRLGVLPQNPGLRATPRGAHSRGFSGILGETGSSAGSAGFAIFSILLNYSYSFLLNFYYFNYF